MKKIALTIFRYGEGIFGGTEAHCRMLAEHLRPYYQVEVLTTTIRKPHVPELDFPAGTSIEQGITVRRFKTEPIDREQNGRLRRLANRAKRIRYRLGQLHLLEPLASMHPVWKRCFDEERRYFESYEDYAPSMQRFIREHGDEYAAILPISYYFTTTVFTALNVPDKCILIPTAHPEKPLYYGIYTQIFTKVRHIAFNTQSERKLCQRVFGHHLAPNSIVGVGIEEQPAADWESVRKKYALPERYVLYVGRLHPSKISSVIPDFMRYKRKYGSRIHDVKLVLAGPFEPSVVQPGQAEIILTGAVSESEKSAIIRHAAVIVNPSQMESLSLLMLEALANDIPMLVNGKCEVMRNHCKLSGAALWYDNRRDFCRKLHGLLTDEKLRKKMHGKGSSYVCEHYDWEKIVGKLRALIESI